MRIEVGDDFKKYRAYRSSQSGRADIYPSFDIAQSYVDSSNGYWICGFDQSDNLIHTQAARLLDLGTGALSNHLNDHSQKYITPNTTPDPDQTHYDGPEALKTMGGKVAYQGDFWLQSMGLGGPRSQGATSLLTRLNLELLHLNWNPDHVFAFVPKRLAEKGVHLRYGFSHCEIGKWIGPDQQVTEEDYFIWMNREELGRKLSKALNVIGRSAAPKPECVVSLKTGA